MKKSIPTFLTILLSSLASAGPVEGVQQLADGLGEVIIILIQFISDTILNINSFDEFLFAKILLFTIILLVVYTVLKKNPILGDNKTIHWIVASAISILSIRYLSNEFIEVILMQYGTLALGVGIFLPLMIFFFFLHQSELGLAGRRMGWIVYGVSFLALWIFRYDEIGSANIIYWIGLVVLLILLLFDSSIHKKLGMSHVNRIMKDAAVHSRVKAQIELEELENNRHHYTEQEYSRLRKKWMKMIEDNIK